MEDTSTAAGGLSLTAFAISMIAVSSVAVVFRFWYRLLDKAPWWDDWLILLALPFSIAQNGLYIYLAQLGLDRHVNQLNAERGTDILRVLWISYFIGDAGIFIPRAAALFMYERLISTRNRAFRYFLWTAHVLNLLWWLSSIAGCLLLCWPIDKYWNISIPGSCRDPNALYIGLTAPSFAIAVIVLLLPLPMIWRSQTGTMRKLLMFGAMAFACVVPAVSLGQLVTTLVQGQELNRDVIYYSKPLLFWAAAEPPVTIVATCLPTYFFMILRVRRCGIDALFTSHDNVGENPTHSERPLSTAALLSSSRASRQQMQCINPCIEEDHTEGRAQSRGSKKHISLYLGNEESFGEQVRKSLEFTSSDMEGRYVYTPDKLVTFKDLEAGADQQALRLNISLE